HALEGADGHAGRAAHAAPQAQEQRAVRGAAQRDARDRDVLAPRAIDRLQRKAAALIEHAVGDGDVLEAAVGFGAALDPPGPALDGAGGDGLPAPIEHRAHLVVAGHVAVRNGDALRGAGVAERIRALRANAIVPGRIHGALADAHVAAAIDVESVAVGIDEHVVDGQVVHTG